MISHQNIGRLLKKLTMKNKIVDVAILNDSEIIISMSDIAETTPRVVSTVTTELVMHGINMIEFMSCVPELIIVVDEKDALK